MQLFRT